MAEATTLAAPTIMPHMRRNVFLLAVCLALSFTGSSLTMVITALAGVMLADPTKIYHLPFVGGISEPALATLPLSLMFVGTVSMTFPASMFMRRFGRRIGFSFGQMIGITAAILSAYAIYVHEFWLLVLGGFVLGMHNGVWQFIRFAAAEVADDAFRSKAISLVMASGVFAAIAGPEIAKHTREVTGVYLFAGSYLAIVVLCLIAICVLQFVRIPPLTESQRKETGRPFREIAKQPAFIVAVLSAMLGYSTMSLVMTATPLAMAFCGFGFNDTASVIQWHVLAMFAPSFVTGHIINKIGVLSVIKIGAVLGFACVVMTLSGIDMLNFGAGLILLGLSWNFMFVGGTTLLTETYRPEERNRVQGINDFMVFGMVSIASLSAGLMQALVGWDAVNMVAIAPIGIVLVAALWLRFSGYRRVA